MKKFALLCILFVVTCTFVQGQNIRIAAASNLRFVLDTIKTVYIKHNKGVTIDITYGSSGTLAQQIVNGAQYDIFMSADKIFPEKLQTEKLIIGDVTIYAYGKLILWSNTIDISKGVQLLTGNTIKKIAIAKPEIAPYGERAIQSLRFYNLYDRVKSKIVFADNISQAAQYASSGNAEAGFIALSLTFAPEMRNGNYIVIDTASYNPIEQACVLLQHARDNNAAKTFFNTILSNEYTSLFEAFGYRCKKQLAERSPEPSLNQSVQPHK